MWIDRLLPARLSLRTQLAMLALAVTLPAAGVVVAGWSSAVATAVAGTAVGMLVTWRVMTRALREANADVGRQVRERTAELLYTNHELQFHKYALDEHAIVAITDRRGRITYANDRFCQVSGYAREELVGRDHRVVNSGLHDKAYVAGMYRTISDGAVWHGEFRNRRKDGIYYWVDATIVPFRDASGAITQYVSIQVDVTARKFAEQQLSQDALHDALTDLPNRACFLDRLEAAIGQAQGRPGYNVAVLFLDLDRFKVVNDSLGHAAGDAMLMTIASRLKKVAGARATVSRLGGDEFTVILEGFAEAGYPEELASGLLTAISEPIPFDGREIHPTASIGVVLFSAGDHHAPEDLLRDADAAMYRAKSAGKNRFARFDAAMHKAAVDRLHIEHDLRIAIPGGQLLLNYQPIVSLESRGLVGFEALVRWRHPERGMVQPNDFIPIAEETGLISELGAWVIREACRQLRAWRDAEPSLPRFAVSINLARRQLADPDLAERIGNVLAEFGLTAADLKVEITESTIMDDARAADSVLSQLKAMGLELHMDDFGTGHSSLSCLHQFPVDVLKVDRSFIRNTVERRDYTAVLRAIVELAHNLNIKVVAEGLETADQVVLLQSLDCDFAQGYFFAKPMAPGEALGFARGPVATVAA